MKIIYQLRLTIWSLVRKNVFYINRPKFSTAGAAFSHDGKYFAVAERKEFKDYVNVYYTHQWELLNSFVVATQDLADLKWSPDDRFLCLYDNPVEYKLCVYTPGGRQVAGYQAYENALGIKTVSW
jgi:hypothetical protein